MRLLNFHKEHFVNVVENPDVFNKSHGTPPGKVHLQVDPDAILPARRIPVSVVEKFKEELHRLESIKIIAPVDQLTDVGQSDLGNC